MKHTKRQSEKQYKRFEPNKYTKGNWKAEKSEITKRFNVFTKGQHIAELNQVEVTGEELEANAKLIAAAPELLKALKDIQTLYAGGKELLFDDLERITEKAIKKAT